MNVLCDVIQQEELNAGWLRYTITQKVFRFKISIDFNKAIDLVKIEERTTQKTFNIYREKSHFNTTGVFFFGSSINKAK